MNRAEAGAIACWQARPMQGADLDRVYSIEREVYPFPWTRGNFADSLAAGYDAWVFESDGRLLGYAILMWLPDEAHLLNIAVAKDLQGRGYGRAFLDWLLRQVQSRGLATMLLEVRPSNTAARALYERASFRQIGVRRSYYPAGPAAREDALVLVRSVHGDVKGAT